MKKQKGSRWHPARIPGHAKFRRAKDVNEIAEKERKMKERKKTKNINIKNQDWSIK